MTELSPEAKKLLRVAREDFSPADQRITAVRNALHLRIYLARGGGGAGGGGAAGAGAWGIARLLGFGLIATTFAAGATLIGARELARRSGPDVAARPAQPVSPTAIVTTPAQTLPIGVQRVQGVQRMQEAEPEVTRGAAVAVDADARPVAAVNPSEPRLALQKPRGAAVAHEPPPAIRSGSARAAARDARAPAAARAPASDSRAADARDSAAPAASAAAAVDVLVTQAPTHAAADDTLAREVALLTRARAALAQRAPLTALALLDEHAALFANGIMRQERLATRVLALCALERRAEAIAAKRELERIAPRSPHLMRIRTSCAAEDASSEVK